MGLHLIIVTPLQGYQASNPLAVLGSATEWVVIATGYLVQVSFQLNCIVTQLLSMPAGNLLQVTAKAYVDEFSA